jgi:hypothetical protein
MHRVAVIGAGTLDSLPHNGAVVTLLAVCGSTTPQQLLRHRDDVRLSSARCSRWLRGDRAGHAVRVVLTRAA